LADKAVSFPGGVIGGYDIRRFVKNLPEPERIAYHPVGTLSSTLQVKLTLDSSMFVLARS
jgi:hypothetical protein